MVDYEKPYDYKKQVKALRYCSGTPYARCSNCPMHDKGVTDYATPCGILSDAAAAIEALLKENKELIEDHPEMVEADGHWEWRKPNGEVLMPKRGKWIEENRRPRSSQFVCSECHRTAYDPQPTRDKEWKKRCRYAYCPNCGAKMEVQE